LTRMAKKRTADSYATNGDRYRTLRKHPMPGRSMTPERYRESVAALGMTQREAGKFFGYQARTGESWADRGPPTPLAMLLYLMEFENILPAELESMLAHQVKQHPKPLDTDKK
jgi:hypothetical protein